MKAFVELVVKELVDFPDQVVVDEIRGEQMVVFELRVNPSDVGKIIGKQGRTIEAIRALLTSVGAKLGKRTMLEIIEPAGRVQPKRVDASGNNDRNIL